MGGGGWSNCIRIWAQHSRRDVDLDGARRGGVICLAGPRRRGFRWWHYPSTQIKTHSDWEPAGPSKEQMQSAIQRELRLDEGAGAARRG